MGQTSLVPKKNGAQARGPKAAPLGQCGQPPTRRAQKTPPTQHPAAQAPALELDEERSHVPQSPMQQAEEDAPDEVLAPLFALDEGVVNALERGDIRLLRRSWLLARPDDSRIENRQALERREAQGESPLLSGQEAVALLKRGTRGVGGAQDQRPSPVGRQRRRSHATRSGASRNKKARSGKAPRTQREQDSHERSKARGRGRGQPCFPLPHH